MARAFASNEQFASLPIDVFEGHEHDLAGAEPKSGQNEQDGEIAAASSGLPIALAEQPPHLIRRQRWWYRGQSPIGYREDCTRQVVGQIATKP